MTCFVDMHELDNSLPQGSVFGTNQALTDMGYTVTSANTCYAFPQSEPLINLSVADGLQLSAAIVAVWAIGFATRMGIKALNSDESEK